jgi:hypothetical protein
MNREVLGMQYRERHLAQIREVTGWPSTDWSDPFVGHHVPLGQYVNAESNKCSNKKRANLKCLKIQYLSNDNIALFKALLLKSGVPTQFHCWFPFS